MKTMICIVAAPFLFVLLTISVVFSQDTPREQEKPGIQYAPIPPDFPPRVEVVNERYPNGLKKVVTIIEEWEDKIDGRKVGRLEFHKNGRLRSYYSWKDDKPNGSFREYLDDGSLKLEGYYREGRKHGRFIIHYPGGGINRIENWDNDVRDGKYVEYDEEGNVMNEYLYKKGERIRK